MHNNNSLNNKFFKSYLYPLIFYTLLLIGFMGYICSYFFSHKLISESTLRMDSTSAYVHSQIEQMNIIGKEISTDKTFNSKFKHRIPGYFVDVKSTLSQITIRDHLFTNIVFYDSNEERVYTSKGIYPKSYLFDTLNLWSLDDHLQHNAYNFWLSNDDFIHYIYPIETNYPAQKTSTGLIFSIPTGDFDQLIKDSLVGIEGVGELYANNTLLYATDPIPVKSQYFDIPNNKGNTHYVKGYLKKTAIFKAFMPLFQTLIVFLLCFHGIGLIFIYFSMHHVVHPLSDTLSKLLIGPSQQVTLSCLDTAIAELITQNNELQAIKNNLGYKQFIYNLLSNDFSKDASFYNACKNHGFNVDASGFLCLSAYCKHTSLSGLLSFLRQNPNAFHLAEGPIHKYFFIIEGDPDELSFLIDSLNTHPWENNQALFIGIGPIVDTLEEINTSYTLARNFLEQAISQKVTICSYYADHQNNFEPGFIWDDINKIHDVLKQGEPEQFIFITSDLKHTIRGSGSFNFCLSLYTTYVYAVFTDYGHPNVPPLPSYLPANDRVITTQCQPMYQRLNPFSLIKLLSQRVCYI